MPNTNARQLKIQQSRSLVFVVKGTRNIFFSDFLVQLQRAATLYGYNGIVSYLDENANEIDAAEKILREIKAQRHDLPGRQRGQLPAGLCEHHRPLGADHAGLRRAGLSRTSRWWAWMTGLRPAPPWLSPHRGRATARSQFWAVRPPATPVVMRRLGAQEAMEDAGLILFDDRLYGLSNYDFESAYHAMNSLLARRAEFTALFAMSDVIAFGAIRALVSAGFRVPEDVSVIGFDGITMSRYCVPVMTTIVQPSEQIALQSIELLVRQIEHGAPAQTITLQPELQQSAKA